MTVQTGNPVAGIGLMLLGVFLFCINDAVGKWLVATYPVAQFLLIPTVPRRLAILETKGPADPEFIALSKRSAALGAVLGLMALVVLWRMVSKPA